MKKRETSGVSKESTGKGMDRRKLPDKNMAKEVMVKRKTQERTGFQYKLKKDESDG